jgi:hypothetical protein
MKQITSAQMGGPCDAVVTGNTANKMAKNGGAHLISMTDDAHMPVQAMMQGMSDDDSKKWMAGFQTKFDAAPEM